MSNEYKKQLLRERGVSGDLVAMCLLDEISSVEGIRERAKQALRKEAEMISSIVNQSISFVDGDETYLVRFRSNALDHDALVSEINEKSTRLAGLYYIADRMIEKES